MGSYVLIRSTELGSVSLLAICLMEGLFWDHGKMLISWGFFYWGISREEVLVEGFRVTFLVMMDGGCHT